MQISCNSGCDTSKIHEKPTSRQEVRSRMGKGIQRPTDACPSGHFGISSMSSTGQSETEQHDQHVLASIPD